MELLEPQHLSLPLVAGDWKSLLRPISDQDVSENVTLVSDTSKRVFPCFLQRHKEILSLLQRNAFCLHLETGPSWSSEIVEGS